MSDIVIRAEHLSKMYRLGVINNGTLWKDLQTWLALKTGKEDPHSKIGENKYAGDKDHFWALKDLNFEIKRGDRVGIIGKNGAGKSTLLKILSRITAPTEGRIKIKGKVASLLEVGTGFHGELTGRENIYLNGAILGMKKRQIDRKLDEIIDFSGIEHHIDTPVKRYSSGMYVRLAFAVAAHLDSDILIADEVLAVGDAEFQKKALGKMQDLSEYQGRTVLFVSHNIAMIEKLCKTGFLLMKGNLLKTGSVSDIISDYYLKEMNNILPINDWFECSINRQQLHSSIIYDRIQLKSNGLVTTEILQGSQMSIDVVLKDNELKKHHTIAIANHAGQWIVSYSTWMYSEKIAGVKRIKLDIPSVKLSPGRYKIYLNCYAMNESDCIDRVESAAVFNIIASREYYDGMFYESRWGVVALDGNLRCEK